MILCSQNVKIGYEIKNEKKNENETAMMTMPRQTQVKDKAGPATSPSWRVS